jgi:Ca2+-binding RTX toxin-like protein
MGTGPTDTIPGDITSTTTLGLNVVTLGSLQTVTDQDWYQITLAQNQRVDFTLIGSGATPVADTVMTVYDATGLELVSNDDRAGDLFSEITFIAATAGDYFVAAASFNGTFSGDYELTAFSDRPTSNQSLISGTPIAGIFDYGTDDDRYRLTTTGSSRHVDLSLHEIGTTGAPVTLTLYDTDGVTQLATVTSSGGDEAAFSVSLPTQGTYFVSASYAGSAPGATSGYELVHTERSQDLGDSIQTYPTLFIDDTDPIRVYISAIEGEIIGGIVADAASPYEQQRIMAGFATWSEVADIQFVQTTVRAQADIEVVLGAVDPYGSAAFPGTAGVQDMRLSNRVPQWTEPGALEEGGFGFLVILHEIGHLIGLNHTHDVDFGSITLPGVIRSNDLGDHGLNQEVYSLMSYNRGWSTGPLGVLPESVSPEFGSGQGPGAIDIAVVQRIYGANTTTGAGNSVYTLDAVNRGYESIWDVSGIDEIRHNGTSDAVIDLRPATLEFAEGGGGYISYLPAFHGGVTIAKGVVIENGIGGDGNDTLTGNAADNTLFGRAGNDLIMGSDGADTLNGNSDNDTLIGGEGADSMIGGVGDDRLVGGIGAEVLDGSPGGSDTLDYSGAASQVIVRLWNNTASGDPIASGDTILNFENVGGGAGNDNLSGNHLANVLSGDGGSDSLFGNGGDDTLSGGANADSLIGGNGDDVLRGGLGADSLDGSPGGSDTLDYSGATGAVTVGLWNNSASGDPVTTGDTIRNFENVAGGAGDDNITGNHLANILTGNAGGDTINGSGGDDTLDAGAGTDSIIGGAGNDRLIGGIGAEVLDGSPADSDTLDYSGAAGTVTVALWNNSVSGDPVADGDTIRNFENVETGAGNDLLVGNHLANGLTGNGGNDTLIGAAGNDTLSGGAQNDVLRGGAGQDELIGGTGLDFLTGGDDTDVFIFANVVDAGLGADRDQIMDFAKGVDIIDISDMVPGVFDFRGTAPFSLSGSPELRLFETPTGATILQIDVDGDAVIDAEIRISAVTGLTASEFVL